MKKGRLTMQPSPQTTFTSIPAPVGGRTRSRRTEDLVYQAVTIAAILMVLGSLWIF